MAKRGRPKKQGVKRTKSGQISRARSDLDPYAGHAVYFCSNGEAVKVGYSANVRLRVSSMETGSSRTIHLLGAAILDSEADARKLEGACHAAYKKAGKHVRGEWFNLTDSDVLMAINHCGVNLKVKTIGGEMATPRERGRRWAGDQATRGAA